tara:strand:- start:2376 stop:2837 length:462 start_codon:yes stop_codon:yes gene_type:complete
MAQNETLEGGQETGGEFRQKFEAIQAENDALKSTVLAQVAGRFDHVSADDLVGVEVEQLEAKAQELYEVRSAERQTILAEGLKSSGFNEEQIASIVAGNASPAPVTKQTVPSVVEQMGRLGGAPLGNEQDTSQMSPAEKIAHGISQRNKRQGS